MFKRSQEPEWNIFARELQIILAHHNFRLGHLNDRAGIHPQKVARLQRSLRQPKFNVLSPSELSGMAKVLDQLKRRAIGGMEMDLDGS